MINNGKHKNSEKHLIYFRNSIVKSEMYENNQMGWHHKNMIHIKKSVMFMSDYLTFIVYHEIRTLEGCN